MEDIGTRRTCHHHSLGFFLPFSELRLRTSDTLANCRRYFFCNQSKSNVAVCRPCTCFHQPFHHLNRVWVSSCKYGMADTCTFRKCTCRLVAWAAASCIRRHCTRGVDTPSKSFSKASIFALLERNPTKATSAYNAHISSASPDPLRLPAIWLCNGRILLSRSGSCVPKSASLLA